MAQIILEILPPTTALGFASLPCLVPERPSDLTGSVPSSEICGCPQVQNMVQTPWISFHTYYMEVVVWVAKGIGVNWRTYRSCTYLSDTPRNSDCRSGTRPWNAYDLYPCAADTDHWAIHLHTGEQRVGTMPTCDTVVGLNWRKTMNFSHPFSPHLQTIYSNISQLSRHLLNVLVSSLSGDYHTHLSCQDRLCQLPFAGVVCLTKLLQ